MKRCYVLLVNWNGWADTLECLESLYRNRLSGLRVIVCDNGSTDGSLEHLRDWAEGRLEAPPSSEAIKHLTFPPVAKPIDSIVYSREEAESGGDPGNDARLILIRIGQNRGFAGGNNVGLCYLLQRADFNYVWLLNNDTVVDGQALQALVERMDERPDAGICGSTLLHYDRPAKIQARGGAWYCKWLGLPWHLGQMGRAGAFVDVGRIERRMSYVIGASMFVRRRFLEKVGLMNEEYFLYYEELDWAMRCRGKYSLAYAPDSRVYHKVGGSIGTRSNPLRKCLTTDFYTIRNRLVFTRRFLPEALPTVYVSIFTALLVRLVCGKFEHARMIWELLTCRGPLPKSWESA